MAEKGVSSLFKRMAMSIDTRKGPFSPKEKAMMLLTQETHFGIHATG